MSTIGGDLTLFVVNTAAALVGVNLTKRIYNLNLHENFKNLRCVNFTYDPSSSWPLQLDGGYDRCWGKGITTIPSRTDWATNVTKFQIPVADIATVAFASMTVAVAIKAIQHLGKAAFGDSKESDKPTLLGRLHHLSSFSASAAASLVLALKIGMDIRNYSDGDWDTKLLCLIPLEVAAVALCAKQAMHNLSQIFA